MLEQLTLAPCLSLFGTAHHAFLRSRLAAYSAALPPSKGVVFRREGGYLRFAGFTCAKHHVKGLRCRVEGGATAVNGAD